MSSSPLPESAPTPPPLPRHARPVEPADRAARLMLLGYGVGLSWGSALVDIEPGCRIAHTEWPAHG